MTLLEKYNVKSHDELVERIKSGEAPELLDIIKELAKIRESASSLILNAFPRVLTFCKALGITEKMMGENEAHIILVSSNGHALMDFPISKFGADNIENMVKNINKVSASSFFVVMTPSEKVNINDFDYEEYYHDKEKSLHDAFNVLRAFGIKRMDTIKKVDSSNWFSSEGDYFVNENECTLDDMAKKALLNDYDSEMLYIDLINEYDDLRAFIEHFSLERIKERNVFNDKGVIAETLRDAFQNNNFESLYYIFFNKEGNVIDINIDRGEINTVLMSKPTLLNKLLREDVYGVWTGHNHPSGSLEPSRDDRAACNTFAEMFNSINKLHYADTIVSKSGITYVADNSAEIIEKAKEAAKETPVTRDYRREERDKIVRRDLNLPGIERRPKGRSFNPENERRPINTSKPEKSEDKVEEPIEKKELENDVLEEKFSVPPIHMVIPNLSDDEKIF